MEIIILTLKNKSNVKLLVFHILQHTSLYALPKLIEFLDQQGIDLIMKTVNEESIPSPGTLTINSAELNAVEQFNSWLEKYQGKHQEMLKNWVKSYEFNVDLNARFIKYINVLDKIRNVDFADTFLRT